jgi:predicted tellurium resistance membrane protein TerC
MKTWSTADPCPRMAVIICYEPIVIGMAAASLPSERRNKAIAYRIAAAILFRIPFAALTYYLLGILGIMLIGSCLLFYVCH